MARFASLDLRLDPYAGTTNLMRSRELDVGSKSPGRTARNRGLSVIVLNLDAPKLLSSVLGGFQDALREFSSRGISVELLVGDTGSTDHTVLQLMHEPPEGVAFVRGLSYHFSSNNNVLVGRSQHQSLLFLNNDVLINENATALVDAYKLHISTGDIASVALDFEDARVQHAGVDFLRDERFFGLPFHPGAHEIAAHEVGRSFRSPAVTGAFLIIDADLFIDLGGFDEKYESECQDIDLCLKAHRVGVGCRVLDVGPLVHLENATRPKGEENWSDRRRFIRRWSSYIETL